MIIFGILAGGVAGETIGQILTKIKIMSENNSGTNQGAAGYAVGSDSVGAQSQIIGKWSGKEKYEISSDSIGAQRVGISFNPSADHRVDSIKKKAAILINEIHEYFQLIESSEAKRCFAVAMAEVESAAMWAVKGVTKK